MSELAPLDLMSFGVTGSLPERSAEDGDVSPSIDVHEADHAPTDEAFFIAGRGRKGSFYLRPGINAILHDGGNGITGAKLPNEFVEIDLGLLEIAASSESPDLITTS